MSREHEHGYYESEEREWNWRERPDWPGCMYMYYYYCVAEEGYEYFVKRAVELEGGEVKLRDRSSRSSSAGHSG